MLNILSYNKISSIKFPLQEGSEPNKVEIPRLH